MTTQSDHDFWKQAVKYENQQRYRFIDERAGITKETLTTPEDLRRTIDTFIASEVHKNGERMMSPTD